MKSTGLVICLLSLLIAAPVASGGRPAMTYAVVVKQSTYDNPEWQVVADALVARHAGELFLWGSSLSEVQAGVAAFQPTHIGFVCELATATPTFIQYYVWSFTRALDSDIYCDAVWGIITGYNAQDALNLVTGPQGFEVKTNLSGTSSCDLAYYTQGLCTSEATYGRYSVKYSDSLESTTYEDGPTDRTEWLVTMINEGIDLFDYDPVDIFYTSGHGGHNIWQLHYPTAGAEGYFRSINGQVYGDPYAAPNININSSNPKIYFGLGNCDIGKILNVGSMAPSWIHTGSAFQYTGYLIGEGSNSHQHGGTKSYFYRVARNNTWAESYFLANQALRFDMINGTPGASPPDLNGSALYGDPGMQALMSHEGVYREPLFSTELSVNPGALQDTVTFRIRMNREGSPGFTSKWGERHPAVILPIRAENITVLHTDAMQTVITDDFALMYIWHQGQPPLAEGATREVIFACDHYTTVVDGDPFNGPRAGELVLCQNNPNPFRPQTRISYRLPKSTAVSLQIFDLSGAVVASVVDEVQAAGNHSVIWTPDEIAAGAYFYRIVAGNLSLTKKCIVVR